MSKELSEPLALNQSEMMIVLKDMDKVNCSEPPIAEEFQSGTQPNDTSPGSSLGKKIVH